MTKDKLEWTGRANEEMSKVRANRDTIYVELLGRLSMLQRSEARRS